MATNQERSSNGDMAALKPCSKKQPRPYQEEIYLHSLKNNTIVCLGTGTGKTFIAVMLIRELSSMVRAPYQEDGKRTFFLVPSVPLVLQQAECIREHTDLKVGEYFGEKDVDNWDKEKWHKEFEENQVLVMTYEIFRTICHHKANILPLSKVNLLIFDECHHAYKTHPCREIMRCFDTCPLEQQPRILGLTASLVQSCKPDALKKDIEDLEATLLSRVKTAPSGDYGTKPREFHIKYKCPKISTMGLEVLYEHLIGVIDFFVNVTPANVNPYKTEEMPASSEQALPEIWPQEISSKMKDLKKYLRSLLHVLNTMGPWCANEAAKLFRKDIEQSRASSLSIHWPFANSLYSFFSSIMGVTSEFLEKFMEENHSEKKAKYFSPPVLQKLMKVLEAFNPSAIAKKPPPSDSQKLEIPQLSCLIFVKRRITAEVLYKWLNELKCTIPELNFLSPYFVVGQGTNNCITEDGQMKAKEQKKALDEFQTGAYNVIVATSVVEEGLDVPMCNLVVMFDKPETVRSYVQSKGRARKKDATYVILLPIDEVDAFSKKIQDFQLIENALKQIVSDRETEPTLDDLEEQFDDRNLVYMPQIGENAPRITGTEAVTLIHRYCTGLPTDSFINLAPYWEIEESEDRKVKSYRCTLYLPINSPLRKPVQGAFMRNKKLARKSAALEACKTLHKIGEFNDNLLPVIHKVRDFEDEVDEAGRKRKNKETKKFYNKKTAEIFKGPLPEPGMPCYFYMLKMNLTHPVPEEYNTRKRAIHNPANTQRGLGILTTQKIPPICAFPLFTKCGQIMVNLELLTSSMVFTMEDLEKLKKFHKCTFSDVLRMEDNGKIQFNHDSETGVLIVPLNHNGDSTYSVDWEFIDKVNVTELKLQQPSSEELEKYQFKAENYSDAVVIPWYHDLTDPKFCTVEEIHHDMTPNSTFPGLLTIQTFRDYYQNKYGKTILCSNQPLLEVDHISNELNALRSPHISSKGTALKPQSEKKKKAKRENLDQKQLLVPELCIIHPFPASFWRKVLCLPSILYRLNYLLLAEQLRRNVAKDTGVGKVDLPDDFNWDKLDYGWNLADVLKGSAANQRVRENLCRKRLYSSDSDSNSDIDEAYVAGASEKVMLSLDEEHADGNVSKKPYFVDASYGELLPNREEMVTSDAPDQLWLAVADAELKTGPNPSIILEALTMMNAADYINLERLETIGDSFLKYAVAEYAFCTQQNKHEGYLSCLRSKQISNHNLYRLGMEKQLCEYMISGQFLPRVNWIPPCYSLRKDQEDKMQNVVQQHKIGNKGIADCVEALIGAYLMSCGPKGALLFMKWLGLTVWVKDNETTISSSLLSKASNSDEGDCEEICKNENVVNSSKNHNKNEVSQDKASDVESAEEKQCVIEIASPLHRYVRDPEAELQRLYSGLENVEQSLGYNFKNKAYLVQAFTHSSSHHNRVTDCYQRLEFLGDAVLDYLVTRHLFQDKRKHSPGALTDLRSALVNNAFFASLAVRYGFDKHLKHTSIVLFNMIKKYVSLKEQIGKSSTERPGQEDLLLEEEECDCAEEVEVPKALGDVFESVVGAIYLDSGRSLEVVWDIYYKMMKPEIEQFSMNIPKSPIRELYELFPGLKFRSEQIPESDKIKMIASIEGKGEFVGVGRNKKDAKRSAAKRALKSCRYE